MNACRNMLLLMCDQPGVKIMGRHAGSLSPGLVKHVTNPGAGLMYKHNPESFQKMWEEVLEGPRATAGRPKGWVVRAWFEEDLFLTTKDPQEKEQKPDRDWFTQVGSESAKTADGSTRGVNEDSKESPSHDVRILV